MDPDYFRSDVDSVLQVLGNQILPNGQKGFFYPDNFTFGADRLPESDLRRRAFGGGRDGGDGHYVPTAGRDSSQYLAAGEINLGRCKSRGWKTIPTFPTMAS